MKEKNKFFTLFVVLILLIFISIFILIDLNLNYSSEMDTIKNAVIIEDYVNDNNLNTPFPNWIHLNNDEEKITELMSLSIFEFHHELNKNFVYNSYYDCKYWSYIWSNYWKFNKDEYDLDLIDTEGHIFAILSNENIYCIADQDLLNCNVLN